MSTMNFQRVWEQLKSLEGKEVITLVLASKNRIIKFTNSEMIRQVFDRNRKQWREPTSVPKSAFKNLWINLSGGNNVVVKDVKTWKICPACMVAEESLGVSVISKNPLTLQLNIHSNQAK